MTRRSRSVLDALAACLSLLALPLRPAIPAVDNERPRTVQRVRGIRRRMLYTYLVVLQVQLSVVRQLFPDDVNFPLGASLDDLVGKKLHLILCQFGQAPLFEIRPDRLVYLVQDRELAVVLPVWTVGPQRRSPPRCNGTFLLLPSFTHFPTEYSLWYGNKQLRINSMPAW